MRDRMSEIFWHPVTAASGAPRFPTTWPRNGGLWGREWLLLFPARFAHARYSTGMIDRFLNWGDHGKPKSGKIRGRCQLPCTEVYNNHVRKARQEREFYNACIKTSAEELASLPEVLSGPQQPWSQEFKNTHYTFDFAMSFTLPHQCLQVGPLYFLTTRKVYCFGICCEAVKNK